MPDNLWISTQRQPALGGPSAYGRLQAWYLARLRAEAAKLSQQVRLLTPLSRIDTDRQLLERMVMEATVQDSLPAANAQKNMWLVAGWCVLVISSIGVMLMYNTPPYVIVFFAAVCLIGVFIYVHAMRSTQKARLLGVGDFWQVLQGYGIDLPALTTVEADFERRLAQALLEARLRELAIADYAPDLIMAFDDQLKFTCSNVSSLRILGFVPTELIGRSLSEILLRPKADELKATLDNSKDGSEHSFAVTVISKNGELVDLDVRCEWSNRQQLFFAAATDTTTTKAMERARSDFIAMISHDVSRPLQNLLFTLESLKKGGHGQVDDRARDAIVRVEQNVRSVIDLVSELMDFERSAEASLVLNRIEFDLGELIDETVAQVQDLAESRSITIVNDTDSMRLVADRARLSRVILNLLLNALKFSPQNSEVKLQTDKQQNSVTVRIIDQGPGIPPNLLHAIFNRYFRIDAPIKEGEERMRGAGLGLAICKVFVEAHNGTIGVQSTQGKGSTFWFTIPEETTVQQIDQATATAKD